jgi:putative membrane protein
MDFILPGSTGYLVIKALHIIAVIFWMAGMLYLPRLFVYHHQAETAGSWKARLLVQERNLLKIILNPALIAVWVLAIAMIVLNPGLFSSGLVSFQAVAGADDVRHARVLCGQRQEIRRRRSTAL